MKNRSISSKQQNKQHSGILHSLKYQKTSKIIVFEKIRGIKPLNIEKISYGEKIFRSIFYIQRNIHISSTISYYNILLSIFCQLCLLSNKESFFQDMRYFRYLRKEPVERIPVRITYNSRHIILSYCSEIKQENTSRDNKISFEIWRCWKCGGSNYGTSLIRVC